MITFTFNIIIIIIIIIILLYSSLDGLHTSSYFQVLQSLYQSFGDCTKRTNYNWYQRHLLGPLFIIIIII